MPAESDAFHPTERFAQQLTASQPALYAYLLSLVGDGDQADDLLQQTNLVLWRKSGSFAEGTSFMAWACAVAFNEVRTARKKFARGKLLFDDALLSDVAAAAAAKSDESDARRGALRRCLGVLSDSHRDLLSRHYTRGEPVKAIADEQGRPLQSLYQTLYRVRMTLLDCIRRRVAAAAQATEESGGEA